MAGNFLTQILGPLCTIDVEFADNSRQPVSIKGESGKVETLPLFSANDTVRGQVRALSHRRRGWHAPAGVHTACPAASEVWPLVFAPLGCRATGAHHAGRGEEGGAPGHQSRAAGHHRAVLRQGKHLRLCVHGCVAPRSCGRATAGIGRAQREGGARSLLPTNPCRLTARPPRCPPLQRASWKCRASLAARGRTLSSSTTWRCRTRATTASTCASSASLPPARR